MNLVLQCVDPQGEIHCRRQNDSVVAAAVAFFFCNPFCSRRRKMSGNEFEGTLLRKQEWESTTKKTPLGSRYDYEFQKMEYFQGIIIIVNHF